MEKLLWNEKLNIGVEIVDKAHANLFRIVGKLIELVNSDSNYQNACKEGIKYLEDYSIKHFAEEEAYMRSIRYGGYAQQYADQIKFAVIIVSTIPVLCIYPVIQKYFEKGVMIGAVKG